jgi:MarR family transcriptional regulator, transcriptional regulator for hemolysin
MSSNTPQSQSEVSPLKTHIGFWMRLVSNQVSHSFARKLEETGVTVAEWVVLREMSAGKATTSPSTVAELTGLSRGAVSKLIERLLKKGYVTRRDSSGDRRRQDIKLTPSAVALVPSLAMLADENDEAFFGVISQEERHALRAVLIRIADLNHFSKPPIE